MLKFYTLFSGSSGNCSYITDGRTKILIDAGVSCKRVTEALKSCGEDISQIDALLITHEHTDHVSGVDVLCRRKGVRLFGSEAALCAMAISDEVYDNAVRISSGRAFSLGDITITPFNTPHDTPDPLGFVFRDEKTGKRFGYASDLGHVSREVSGALSGCDAVYIESNHDRDMLFSGNYPYSLKRRVANERGHLSNDDCAAFLTHTCMCGTTYAMLGHLSAENNYPSLAYKTSAEALSNSGVKVGNDMLLYVAPRASRSEVISL